MDSFAEEKLATVENNGNSEHMEQSDPNELNGNSGNTAITGTTVIGQSGHTGNTGFNGHVMKAVHGGHPGSENNVQNVYSGPTGAQGRRRNGSSGNVENCGINREQSDRVVTDESDNPPAYDSNYPGVNFDGTKIHSPGNSTPYYQPHDLVLGIPHPQSLAHPAMPGYPGPMDYSLPSAGIYQQLEGVYPPGYYAVPPHVGTQPQQQGGQQQGGQKQGQQQVGQQQGGQQQGQQPQQGQQQQACPIFIHGNHPSKFIRQKPIQFLNSFDGQVMLAVFVLICFLGVFGLVALILAVVARIKSKRDPLTARKIGKASLLVSVIGAACGIIFYIVLAKITLSRDSSTVVLPEFPKSIN